MNPLKIITVCLVSIIILTFITFSPVLTGHFLNWDDEENVVYCPRIRNFTLKNIPWFFTNFTVGDFKPFTWLTYTVDYAFWKLNPFGYHLGNLLLHTATSCLLFVLLIRLANISGYFPAKPVLLAAFFASLFFALNPLRTESVAWISDRKGVLCVFFYLASIAAYLRYRDREKIAWYLLTLLLAIISLLSKPVAVSLPIIFLLLDIYPLKRMGSGRGRAVIEKIPFLAAAAAAGAMAFLGQSRMQALTSLKVFGPRERVLLGLKTVIFYLVKTLFPLRLSGAYPGPEPASPARADFYLLMGAVVSVTLLVGVLWLRNKKWPLICWFGFLISIFPVSGFFRTGLVTVADRFVYLPSIAVSGCVALFLFGFFKGRRKRVAVAGAGIVIAIFALSSFRQSRVWNNSEKLWKMAVERYPTSPVARGHYGQILFERGADEEAAEQLEAALELLREKPFLEGDIFFAVRSNLAQILGRSGRLPEAAALTEEIIKTRDSWYLHHILAGFYRRMERGKDAALEYERVLNKRPDWVPSLCDYGLLLAQSGKTEKAIALYRQALGYAPASPRTRYNLALAFLDRGNAEEAILILEKLAGEYRENYLVARALTVAYAAGGREADANRLRSSWVGRKTSSSPELPYAAGGKPGLLFPLR